MTRIAATCALLALVGCASAPTQTALDCRATAEECQAFLEKQAETAKALEPKSAYRGSGQRLICAIVDGEYVCALPVLGF